MKAPEKGDFVRSQPIDIPFKTLAQLAKQAGLGKLSKSYVSKLRAEMAKNTKPARATSKPKPPQPLAAAVNTDEPEQQLRAIVIVLGTARVRQLIDQLETQLMQANQALAAAGSKKGPKSK